MPRPNRRQLSPFFVYALLLRGTYASVTWIAPATCLVRTASLAEAVGMTSTRLRRCIRFLAEQGYLSRAVIKHGVMLLTVAPLPARSCASPAASLPATEMHQS